MTSPQAHVSPLLGPQRRANVRLQLRPQLGPQLGPRRSAHRRSGPGQRGVVAVEFGLLLVLLITLAFGISELGRAAYMYDTLTKGARAGARLLMTQAPPPVADAAARTAYEMPAICLAITGSTRHSGRACTDPALLPGLTPQNVVLCDRQVCADHAAQPVSMGGVAAGTTNLVSLRLTGVPFQSLVGFVVPSFTLGDVRATFSVRPS